MKCCRLSFLDRHMHRAAYKPGYCCTKKAVTWFERKQISYKCWDPNPVECLGSWCLFGHLTSYWDKQEWTIGPTPTWSLGTTSMSGCLHSSVGIRTQQVTVTHFFSKSQLNPDAFRNRKCDQHFLLSVYNCPCWLVMLEVLMILKLLQS